MKESLIDIWKKKAQIFEGLKNSMFKTEHVEEIAKARMDICNSCDFIDKTGEKCFVPGTQPCCGICGCKLSWKTRSLSEGCDKKFWGPVKSEADDDEIKTNLNID